MCGRKECRRYRYERDKGKEERGMRGEGILMC
jgi:hypothetical protein